MEILKQWVFQRSTKPDQVETKDAHTILCRKRAWPPAKTVVLLSDRTLFVRTADTTKADKF